MGLLYMTDVWIEKDTLFETGRPVSPENFKGRKSSIQKIIRYVKSASNGNTQHFFLTGERGIGKTSLAKYVMSIVENNYGMTGVYVSNKGNETLEELIDSIIAGILKKIPKNLLKDKVKDIFGNIESLEIKGAKINFKSGKKKSEFVIKDFPYFMQDLINEVNKENGIFLVIDDINGLSESKKFVDWYKNFSDTIAVNDLNLKLYILFAGYPVKFDNLVYQEPSFGRIFNQENLENFSDSEIREFFIETFANSNIKCSEEALNIFTSFSYGLPLIMQQIGESTFWIVEDNEITKDIALKGVINAINEIGHKQLRHILNIISDFEYGSIVLKLGDNDLSSFSKETLEEKLNNHEKSIIDNFLEDMVKYDLLYHVGPENRHHYRFVNTIYYIYFKIKAYDLNNFNFLD